MAENTVKLTCSDCGGTMDIDADKKVLLCPFCGSKKIILESDEVKMAKIQADADVEKARMKHEADMADREELEKSNKRAWIMFFVFLFILLILKFVLLK